MRISDQREELQARQVSGLVPRLYEPALSTNHLFRERNRVQIQLRPAVASCKEPALQGGRRRHVSAFKFRPRGQKVTELLIATDQILFGEDLAVRVPTATQRGSPINTVGVFIYIHIEMYIIAVALLSARVSYQAE